MKIKIEFKDGKIRVIDNVIDFVVAKNNDYVIVFTTDSNCDRTATKYTNIKGFYDIGDNFVKICDDFHLTDTILIKAAKLIMENCCATPKCENCVFYDKNADNKNMPCAIAFSDYRGERATYPTNWGID